MPGHMQQRGSSSWRLCAFVGKGSNGRKRYSSKTFHGTKKEAGIALAAFVAKVAKVRSASSPAEPITVSQTLGKWLDSRRAQLSPANDGQISCRDHAHRASDWIDAGRSTLVTEGQSGSSIRKVHWALRQSLAWAHRRGYCSIIATDGIELPPQKVRGRHSGWKPGEGDKDW